jgi:hypothetical protein
LSVLIASVALLAAGYGGSSGLIGPGGTLGAMTLLRGTVSEADLKLFDFCDPVILKPGRYRRSYDVPPVRRLFIGYGEFAPTRKELDRDYKRSKSDLWVDGHPVNLHAFGISDRTLTAFPPAGGKDVILREWRVILGGVPPGKHTIRYRVRPSSGRSTDATWAFTVTKA